MIWIVQLIRGDQLLQTEPLSQFFGEKAKGKWTLQIEDVFDGDGGELTNWGLEICFLDDFTKTNDPAVDPKNFIISPNPVSDKLSIKMQYGESLIDEIQLFNNIGQNISIRPFYSNSSVRYEMDVSNLAIGLYFISIKTAEGESFIKRFYKY